MKQVFCFLLRFTQISKNYLTVTRLSSTRAHLQVLKNMPERKFFQRLPDNVKPINYALRIQPDLKECTFVGTEDISVKVCSPTKEIILNSLELEVTKASFTDSSSGEVSEAKTEFNLSNETLCLTFPDTIKAGDGSLSLSFNGKLGDTLKGFYRSKYRNSDGEDRYSAVTQFEPTDARRAFPCWDEPSLKATFDISLVVPKDRVALSNMPVVSEEFLDEKGDLKLIKYARTPVMSTYLVAYVVGEFDFVEGTDSDGVLHRVYTPVGKKDQGKFALDVSLKTLPFYKEFFKIPYPLVKMDLIAIADFAMGAMENWGLVTYREKDLLIDQVESSQRIKLRVAMVVGHELAHQWFGNLVTMEWWTHLWLNEGFASWIEYLCVDHIFPEYDPWTVFVYSDYSHALDLDALDNSHPIEVAIGHPSEIDEIFDAVSYNKGASIIRMLYHFIGEEDFRRGLTMYLNKFQHKNTFTEDLWASLEESSKKPVESIMSKWTSEMGFPLITVSERQEGNSRILSISQKKFSASGTSKGDSTIWKVPISISCGRSSNKTIKKHLLDCDSAEIIVDDIDSSDWIKLNPGTVDFYRVCYSADMLQNLIPAVKNMQMEATDRLSLQSDLFALSKAGNKSADEVLKVIEFAYPNEVNFTVWSELTANLGELGRILQYTNIYDGFKAYIRRLYSNIHQKLGWEEKEGESPLDTMLRGTVLAEMGYYGDEKVIEEARRRFEDHFNGRKIIPGNIRGAVYLTVVSNGNEDTYNKMLELLEKSDLNEEINRIQSILGAINDEKLLKKTLDMTLSGKVRHQDILYVFMGVTRTPLGRDLLWNFVKENWDELYRIYAAGLLMSRLIKQSTGKFVSEEKAAEIEKFFEAHPAPSAERGIQQSMENIRTNRKWLDRDIEGLTKFLG